MMGAVVVFAMWLHLDVYPAIVDGRLKNATSMLVKKSLTGTEPFAKFTDADDTNSSLDNGTNSSLNSLDDALKNKTGEAGNASNNSNSSDHPSSENRRRLAHYIVEEMISATLARRRLEVSRPLHAN